MSGRIRALSALVSIFTVLALQTPLSVAAASTDDAITQFVADLGSKNQGARQRAKDELLVRGKAAVPQILAALDGQDYIMKSTAITVLGQLKAKEAVPRLIEVLSDKAPENMPFRFVSAFSLGLIGDDRAFPHLVAMLGEVNDQDEDHIAWGVALIALGYLGKPEAIAQVRESLTAPDEGLRIAAATALGMLGNHDGLQVAIDGTRSTNPTDLLTSIQALGVIGDVKALPRLEEMGQNHEPWGSDVQLAIRQIGYANTPPGKQIEVLRDAVNDESGMIVEWAIATLAKVGTPEARALLKAKSESAGGKEAGIARLKLQILDQGQSAP